MNERTNYTLSIKSFISQIVARWRMIQIRKVPKSSTSLVNLSVLIVGWRPGHFVFLSTHRVLVQSKFIAPTQGSYYPQHPLLLLLLIQPSDLKFDNFTTATTTVTAAPTARTNTLPITTSNTQTVKSTIVTILFSCCNKGASPSFNSSIIFSKISVSHGRRHWTPEQCGSQCSPSTQPMPIRPTSQSTPSICPQSKRWS